MKEFEGLNVPEVDEAPSGEISALQDYECKQVTDHSDCYNLMDCGECIFYQTNIEKFKKWYGQKAL